MLDKMCYALSHTHTHTHSVHKMSTHQPRIGGQVIANATAQTPRIMNMARRFERRRLE